MPHRFTLRVCHEDTELAGIVHHANYPKFIEWARSEWVCALGVDQRALRTPGGVPFEARVTPVCLTMKVGRYGFRQRSAEIFWM